MATERGDEEAPTRKIPQRQSSKDREDGWKKGAQGCRAELRLGLRKLETRKQEVDQAGFYKHLKTVNLEGKRDHSSAYVKDENGVLLRDVELIYKLRVRWFHTLLNAKSPRLDLNIVEDLDQWPENMPLGVQHTMQELTDAIHSLANGKAVGPDGLSVELFKIALNGDPALRWRLLDIVVRIRRAGEVPQQ